MDGVVFRKDGIEFQLNNFEFSFDASGNLIARHTGTGNELVFTTDGGVNVDTVNATTEVTTSTVNATDVTSDTVTATTEVTSPSVDATDVTSDTVSATTEVTSPSVIADALEATSSITDPEGNTITSLSDPVRVTEEAVDFYEEDISLELDKLARSGKSLKFQEPTVWDISKSENLAGFSYQGENSDDEPTGLYFKPDGSKMFITGDGVTKIRSYELSTAWDVSTATEISVNNVYEDDVNNGDNIIWKPDGTELFIYDAFANTNVYEYQASTPWDISTLSKTNTHSRPSSDYRSFFLRDDGKLLFEGTLNGNLIKSELTTAWDISTANQVDTYSLQADNPRGIFWKTDGTAFWVNDRTADKQYQYDVSSAWDMSTASYNNISVSLSNDARDMYWREDGARQYWISANNKSVNAKKYKKGANNGTAIIRWNSGVPADIDSWDLVTFQRTLDNETVTIDVEDSTGTVLKSNISKDTDISDIATSTDVQLRANLSRSDTSNNPTLDYAARRFTR